MGPIFEKELRVSSRRTHTYVARTVYLLALLAFLVAVWGEWVGRLPASPVGRLARMPEAAKAMVVTVVWFQFVASQALALVMLSTSIGEEVRRRTLGVLITTPITGLQIVGGKLLSRLFQVLLLVAASVPVLLLVRVFGGVPADFLAGGVCLTLAMAFLAGALSLFFSIAGGRPEIVILKALMALGVLLALLPLLVASGFKGLDLTSAAALTRAYWVSPYVALTYMTDGLMSGGPATVAIARPGAWLAPCLTALGLALATVAASSVRVRRAAMRQIASSGSADQGAAPERRPGRCAPSARLRRPGDWPVLWKESRLRPGRSISRRLGLTLVALVALGLTYWLLGGELGDIGVHITCCLILWGLGTLGTAAVAAMAVPAEREASTWPLLLVTPLAESHILAAKAIGSLKRSLPFWTLLFVHLLFFLAVGYVASVVPIHMAIIGAGTAAFVTGTGLYFGVRLRKTTTAVIANMGLCILLWVGLLLVAALVDEVLRLSEDLWQWLACLTPWAHVVVVTERATGSRAHQPEMYSWPEPLNRVGFWWTTAVVWLTACANVLAGLAFAWRACRAARRRVF
jgi:hypothetical protein